MMSLAYVSAKSQRSSNSLQQLSRASEHSLQGEVWGRRLPRGFRQFLQVGERRASSKVGHVNAGVSGSNATPRMFVPMGVAALHPENLGFLRRLAMGRNHVPRGLGS